jgi:hypothetical protein
LRIVPAAGPDAGWPVFQGGLRKGLRYGCQAP